MPTTEFTVKVTVAGGGIVVGSATAGVGVVLAFFAALDELFADAAMMTITINKITPTIMKNLGFIVAHPILAVEGNLTVSLIPALAAS